MWNIEGASNGGTVPVLPVFLRDCLTVFLHFLTELNRVLNTVQKIKGFLSVIHL